MIVIDTKHDAAMLREFSARLGLHPERLTPAELRSYGNRIHKMLEKSFVHEPGRPSSFSMPSDLVPAHKAKQIVMAAVKSPMGVVPDIASPFYDQNL